MGSVSCGTCAACVLALDRLPFGYDGDVVEQVEWAGTTFHAIVQVDREEHSRRQDDQLGAVTDYATLETIATLPVGLPVGWGAIDPLMASVLDTAAPGIVSGDAHTVTRLLRPAVHLLAIIKRADHWSQIARVSVLARGTPTAVLTRHMPRDYEQAAAKAQHCRVGLAVIEGREPRELVPPQTVPTPGFARTRLEEVVYRAWLAQRVRTPANSTHASS